MKPTLRITKADGTIEPFSEEKFRRSLRRAGADANVAEAVVNSALPQFTDKMSTRDVYRMARAELKKNTNALAARYSVRRALLDLGPSGFPFERFVASIYTALGYTTSVGLVVDGTCATHEIDVTALKGDECLAIEAKFHNRLGTKSDLKDVLYVKARIDDLLDHSAGNTSKVYTGGKLITNTKFSSNARDYASCALLSAISWDYPKEGSLDELIQKTGTYPITCLATLSREEKQALIQADIPLCNMLSKHTNAMEKSGMSKEKIDEILTEARVLCQGGSEVH